MQGPTQTSANPDLLLAATLFLMSQHALRPRPTLARAVVDHLDRLMAFTELLSPRMLLALPRLREHWEAIGQPSQTLPCRGRIIPFRRLTP